MMLDFLKLKSAISDLGRQVATLRKDKETLMRQREDVAVAPGTKADVITMLCEHIDERSATCPAQLRQSIETRLAFGRDPHKGSDGKNQLGVIGLGRKNHTTPLSALDVEQWLFFLMGATFKKAIAETINGMEWPTQAIPLAGRESLIAELDRKIATLEKDEQELRRTAADAGVSI